MSNPNTSLEALATGGQNILAALNRIGDEVALLHPTQAQLAALQEQLDDAQGELVLAESARASIIEKVNQLGHDIPDDAGLETLADAILATPIAQDTDGDFRWRFNLDGTFVLTGAIAVHNSNSDVPWLKYAPICTSAICDSDITELPSFTFYNFTKLASFDIPSGVTKLGSYVFYGCASLPSINIPSGVTEIGSYVFYNCSVTELSIPSGITKLGSYVFYNCPNLTELSIPSGVTEMGTGVFYGCSSLTSINIPSGVTKISDYLFCNCVALPAIAIPNGVTSIGQRAFGYCAALPSIAIPSSVTSIGNQAFLECTGLTSITIPSGVTSIGTQAFSGCRNLSTIVFATVPTSLGGSSFELANQYDENPIPVTFTYYAPSNMSAKFTASVLGPITTAIYGGTTPPAA